MRSDNIQRLRRIPLGYIHSLDYCCSRIYFDQGKVLILAGNEIYLSEMLERIYNKAHVIAFKRTEEIKRLIYENSDFKEKAVLVEDFSTIKENFDHVIWLKGRKSPETMKEFFPMLAESGNVLIVTSSLLQLLKIKKLLKKNNFQILEIYGFHTLKNLTISLFGRIFKMFGGHDLQDRFHFKFRKDFVSESWLKYTGLVFLIIAQKEKGK